MFSSDPSMMLTGTPFFHQKSIIRTSSTSPESPAVGFENVFISKACGVCTSQRLFDHRSHDKAAAFAP